MADYTELTSLHKKHLEILRYIDAFCKKNDIEYCLAYGSALGAKRHGGPIPWDDDADIYMTAKGYERFRNLFHRNGDKKLLYLQEFQSIDGMLNVAKLRMNGTTFIEKIFKNYDMHHGIYVDIFLLHECPPNLWEKTKGIFLNCYRIIKEMSNNNYDKRKIIKPLLFFLRFFPKRFGLKTAYRQLYKWDEREQNYFSDWELYSGKPRWFIPKSMLFPAQRTSYDGVNLCIPREVEEYLKVCYGEWEIIPDENKIKWAQHNCKYKTDEDFVFHVSNVKNFKDEKL